MPRISGSGAKTRCHLCRPLPNSRQAVQVDAIAQAFGAAIGSVLEESPDEPSAIGQDHLLRGEITRLGSDLDEGQAERSRLAEHQPHRLCRIAAPPLPWHYGIADVAEHMWRQLGGAALPAKADRAGDFAVPDPAPESRQARHSRPIRQGDRTTLGIGVVEIGEEGSWILFDGRKLLARRLHQPHIVRRPAAFERGLVRRQMFKRRFDEFNHDVRSLRCRPQILKLIFRGGFLKSNVFDWVHLLWSEHNGRPQVREIGEDRRRAGRYETDQTAQGDAEAAVRQANAAGTPRRRQPPDREG
ncbi:hypothetical protein BQ8794_30035 [Mesorhizobium prunaredense]|uniref:Uncharacterized protein n=1 Tax=Mesorhizobium prunaredense TaxID=1631249 RepID=A0A1R3V9I5_9HYPH|nr:hypothetical protein BQ8794_30035 [Mesorhizobium prunaredense]